MFCSIKDIVLLNVRGQNEIGMFVYTLDIGDCIGAAHHIVKVQGRNERLDYIPISLVRNLAMQIPISRDTVHITPLANHIEIE